MNEVRLRRADAESAVSRYLAGESSNTIAPDFSVHPNTILKLVREAGGTIRPAGGVTPIDADKASEMYRSGRSMPEVAAALSASVSGVYRALKRSGTQRDQFFTRLKADQIERAVSLYADGRSQTEIATELGIDRAAVRYWLKKKSVGIRSQGDACRKLTLSERAFDDITEESAYWAGFLMADGSIRERKGKPWAVSLALLSKDQPHLEEFREFLEPISQAG